MTPVDAMVWFLLILIADVVAMVTWDVYKRRTNKRLDNTRCDDCNKVRRTKLSPDRKHWLCRTCMPVYKTENKEVII